MSPTPASDCALGANDPLSAVALITLQDDNAEFNNSTADSTACTTSLLDLAAELHARFHTVILDAVHLPALALILRPLTEVVVLTSAASIDRSGPGDWDVEAHLPILSALRERNPDAAAATPGPDGSGGTGLEQHSRYREGVSPSR